MLSNQANVAQRFQRSIRIDADFDAPDALEGFICHQSNQMILENMARLIVESDQRAFTWTGPYGGGKSSLALALTCLVGNNAKLRKMAAGRIGQLDCLRKAFPTGKDPWLVVPVIGRRSDPIEDIRRSVSHAVKISPGRARTRRRQTEAGGRDIIKRLETEAQQRPSGGVLLVIDEMGKFLEGARSEETDIHFFQELAEASSRCEGRLVVLGILHQAFEQYADRLGRETRDEWAKVQGRYIDIPIITTTDEVIDLIGQAILCMADHPQSQVTSRIVADAIAKRRPGSPGNLVNRLDACWPLHPVTAALLGPISRRRFAQNERSVFGFLSSAEPWGFQEFLRDAETTDGAVFDPSRLWNYLMANAEPAIMASPDGHRWAQGVEAIKRCEKRGTPLHIRLAKTIAVIDLLHNGCGIMAESSILQTCGGPSSRRATNAALKDLERWSITVFRKHLDAWTLYAGSDFDIQDAVTTAMALNAGLDIDRLCRLAQMPPLLAKRHYHKTGTLRWFETGLAALEDCYNAVRCFKPSDGSAGKFILAIPSKKDTEKKSRDVCRHASKLADDYPVAIGFPSNAGKICELGAELIALESVRNTSTELEGDAVARRELRMRLAATASRLEEELRTAFTDAVWYVRGRKYSNGDEKSLYQMASELADDTFSCAPVIHSELINRVKPSGNSQSAVRRLLHQMVKEPKCEYLGIEGFKAERGLYSTVLAMSGLHRQNAPGEYEFSKPDPENMTGSSFEAMWDAAEQHLKRADGMVLLSDIQELWTKPPYGVRHGMLPVLSLAFILANRASIAVYAEDMFRPDMNDFVADQLLQDPTRIKLRKSRFNKRNKTLLRDIAEAVSAQTNTMPGIDPLSIARELVRFAFSLPAWTQRSMSLSRPAKVVRDTLLHASDPYKLLFVDLPLVFGNEPKSKIRARFREVFQELGNAYSDMLTDLRHCMLKAIGHKDSDYKPLQERAFVVIGLTGNLRLDAFATRLVEFTGDHADMESIAGLAVHKPPRDWADRESEQATLELAEFALKFRHAEMLAEIRGRKPNEHALGIVFGTGEQGHTVMKSFGVAASEKTEVAAMAEKMIKGLNGSGTETRLALAALAQVGARILQQDEKTMTKTTKQ